MPRSDVSENISPFDDRVTTAHGIVAGYDLPDIHGDIRQRIEQTIQAVQQQQRHSQVILLAGDAGTGKTHLLRTFQSHESSAQLGTIYVGGSNHWAVGEFQARLLDWMIEALAAPSPNQDHLLLERVRAIGFRAVDQLLANPVAWRHCLARSRRGWWRSLVARLWRPSHESLEQLASARDPSIFKLLDFARFSAYVCDRFLADKSNLTHRYALRVLLTYLFPRPGESGVGNAERALHWFRGRGDSEYFTRRLGANERLDRQFSLFEAVKLLIHLFSPAVSCELSTDKHPIRPKVFLLVFDQAEGRNELFNSPDDWKDFFAHLSELYNTLPNVVVLFTMTLKLRGQLHSEMERQFKDRIRMDEGFVLHHPNETQLCELYQSRVRYWLRDEPLLRDSYNQLVNPYEPFNIPQLLEIVGSQTIRDTLESLNQAFHKAMCDLTVEPAFDFHFCLNELRRTEPDTTDFDYTSEHLETIRQLLSTAGSWLAESYGVRLHATGNVEAGSPSVLWLRFTHPENEKNWAVAYLARLTFRFKEQLAPARKQIARKTRSRNFLYLLRAREFDPETPERQQDQIFSELTPSDLEFRLRALLHLVGRRQAYERDGQWGVAQEFVRGVVAKTYLDRLFREARRRLHGIHTGTLTDAPEPSVEPVADEV
jgi:hypothetical protein